MRNILLALGIGVVTTLLVYVPGWLKLGEAVAPGVLAMLVAYFVLARRTFKKVEKTFTDAAAALQSMPPRLDLAISTMEQAYAYAPHQIGVRSQIDSQIGMIHFMQKEFNRALPYLQRSLRFGHWMAGAMLGVIYYKKKDHQAMRDTFEVVVRRGKKQSLAWALYAYLLTQTNQRDEAQQLLVKGLKATKDDQRLKDALLALQNNKKIKMRAYKEQWYQFHLERPPAQYQMQPVGKISRASRRGRW